MPSRGSSSVLLVALAAWSCGPTPAPAVRCPEPAVATAPRSPPPDPGPAPAAAPATSRSGVRPTADFPIPYNCEAPLPVIEEVTRLLTAAAAHSTHSRACVDGRGQRLAVNDILVCPTRPEGSDQAVEVFYQVVTYPEGDTRGCSDDRPCDWLAPTASDHLVTLRLRPSAHDPTRGSLVDLPDLPGFADATPLAEEHDGSCYGRSPAFVPAEISIGR